MKEKKKTNKKKENKNAVYCIIKNKVFISSAYQTTEYAKLELTPDGQEYTTTIIPSRIAREIIATKRMKEKINNEHGRVWELPKKSFRRRFKGKYIDEAQEE
jgi:DNA polymerase III sliding clamp (beta) subunit (PCNA family)